MERKIILSKRTSKKLDKLIKYLETEWSMKVKKDFIKKLDKSLKHIQQFPDSFESTDFVKGLHRCVVTKQTTLYYRYNERLIEIVTLFDNRMNPDKLREETNKTKDFEID